MVLEADKFAYANKTNKTKKECITSQKLDFSMYKLLVDTRHLTIK